MEHDDIAFSTAISRLSATALSSSREQYYTPITHCSQKQPMESHVSHSYFGGTNEERSPAPFMYWQRHRYRLKEHKEVANRAVIHL
jgi:hypothetical protein